MTKFEKVRYIEQQLISSLHESLKKEEKWLDIFDTFTSHAIELSSHNKTIAALMGHIQNLEGITKNLGHVESLMKQTFESLPFGLFF